MTTLDDLRRICSQFPGAVEGDGEQFGFSVPVKGRHKGFCWSWMERTDPKGRKTPNFGVLAIRVPSLSAKELLLSSDPRVFFTEPHYNGYPAILARLDEADPGDMEVLLEEAWKCFAPKPLLEEWAARRPRDP